MGTPSSTQTRMTSWRSIPSSFDSSSGVRWFAIDAPLRGRKSPLAQRRSAGYVEPPDVGAGFNVPALQVHSSPRRIIGLRDGRKAARFGGAFRRRQARTDALLRRWGGVPARARPRSGRRGLELDGARPATDGAPSTPRAGPAGPRRLGGAARRVRPGSARGPRRGGWRGG